MSTRKTRRISIIAGVAVAAAIALISGGIVAASGDPTPTLENLSKPTPTWVETTPVPETPPSTATTGPAAVTGATSTAQQSNPTRLFTITAGSNDGLIYLTKFACGTARNWQAVAADNKILGPEYWVITGQQVKVNCDSVTKPLPVVAKPAAAPPAAKPAVAPKFTTTSWTMPLPGKCLHPNGSREFGVSRPGHMHAGIDLGASSGTPIRAMHAGTAHHGYQASGAGIYVWVDHGDGTSSWYFHMSSRAVANGAHVSAGQVIGYVGMTGNATAYHLHLETHIGSAKVDPVKFLRARGVEIGC